MNWLGTKCRKNEYPLYVAVYLTQMNMTRLNHKQRKRQFENKQRKKRTTIKE